MESSRFRRIIVIQLLLKDTHNEDVSVYLVSAYAPVGNTPDNVWNEYLDKLATCIVQKRKSDILIIGTDANSSIDASITSRLLDIDHCAIFLKLRVLRRLKRKTETRQHIQNLVHHILR